MEESLKPGDFVFISKWQYGARLPITLLALPFLHSELPFTENRPSYLDAIQLPYRRLPGLESIQRNDIVVFNYPLEIDAPVDKRDYYIKRCKALPGDTLLIKAKEVFINGRKDEAPGTLKFNYKLRATREIDRELLDSLGITEGGLISNMLDYEFPLNDAQKGFLEKQDFIVSVTRKLEAEKNYHVHVFPYSRHYPFNADFWGPVVVPYKGLTVQLNDTNIVLYERIIREYEGHLLIIDNGLIYIDDSLSVNYTFDMNYYFMMGDNRDNSSDSRFWGFVPENHIIGKAWFRFFSWDVDAPWYDKLRWNRMFQRVK